MLFFRREERYVLDSASIIDGRVVNLFEKKFLEGKIIIPYLVRIIARKQIGTDAERVLNQLRKITLLEFVEKNVDGVSEEISVLKLASRRKAKVITTSDEYNRHLKSFPDVRIINIKELHSLLTPIFNPNRIISVYIKKRGINSNEGVGYIEGVKIVVMNGAKFLNQRIWARVISMLQSDSGNLVFAEAVADLKEKSINTDNRKNEYN